LKEELCSRFSVRCAGDRWSTRSTRSSEEKGAGEQKASWLSSPGGYVKAAESADSADL